MAAPTPRKATAPSGKTLTERPSAGLRSGLQLPSNGQFHDGSRLPGLNADPFAVHDATGEPWRYICSLECRSGRDKWSATGFLAAPTVVVTAAHAFFPNDRLRATSVRVLAGRTGPNEWLGEATVAEPQFGYLPNSTSCGQDIGCLLLAEPFPGVDGHLELWRWPKSTLEVGWRVNVCGYADEAGGEVASHWDGELVAVENDTILYYMNTLRGQSGSPIWVTFEDRRRYVIGVHAYPADDSCITGGRKANGGSIITAEVLGNLLAPHGHSVA
jgi:V8-like Glu-specific endopeptidase